MSAIVTGILDPFIVSNISVQLGAKKPMRMERERKVEIEVEVIENVKYFSLKK